MAPRAADGRSSRWSLGEPLSPPPPDYGYRSTMSGAAWKTRTHASEPRRRRRCHRLSAIARVRTFPRIVVDLLSLRRQPARLGREGQQESHDVGSAVPSPLAQAPRLPAGRVPRPAPVRLPQGPGAHGHRAKPIPKAALKAVSILDQFPRLANPCERRFANRLLYELSAGLPPGETLGHYRQSLALLLDRSRSFSLG